MAKTLFRNGIILTLAKDSTPLHGQDILIDGDRIAAIGPNLVVSVDTTIIDATDMYIMPGLINSHIQYMADRITRAGY